MGVVLPEDSAERISQFVVALERWNRVYNLTAISDLEQMVGYHVLDSLAALPWLPEGPLLDVGSGAGLPGIPLALARPRQVLTLLDSNAKRTRFVQQMIADLGLANVSVQRCRVQAFSPAQPVKSLVSRAFAPLPDLLSAVDHVLADDARLSLYQGQRPDAELARLDDRFELERVIELDVPGVVGARHLVQLVKVL